MPKIWTDSGDSHFLEPEDLGVSRLPKRLQENGEWRIEAPTQTEGRHLARVHTESVFAS